jgi:hypothetical protein
MKTKLLLTIVFMLSLLSLHAQDVIIKKNGEEINSKILEISSTEIKYKRADYMEGPVYVVNRWEVFIIKYADGRKEIISPVDAPSQKMAEKKIFTGMKYCISLGYGLGTGTGVWLYGYGNNRIDYGYYNVDDDGSLNGPYYAKFEYRLTEEWGVGVNLAYVEYNTEMQSTGWDYATGNPITYTAHYDYKSFSSLLHATWHFSGSEKVDPYFGFGLGIRNDTWKYKSDNPYMYSAQIYNDNDFPLGFETTFGLRVTFTKHIGAYAETGIAKSVVQFGLIAKF